MEATEEQKSRHERYTELYDTLNEYKLMSTINTKDEMYIHIHTWYNAKYTPKDVRGFRLP